MGVVFSNHLIDVEDNRCHSTVLAQKHAVGKVLLGQPSKHMGGQQQLVQVPQWDVRVVCTILVSLANVWNAYT